MAKILFILLILIVKNTFADEEFQNADNLCTGTCNCEYIGNLELDIDCQNRSFQHIIANWPPHNTTLKAIFSNNNFPTLQQLPPSEQVLHVVFSHCNIKQIAPKFLENVPRVESVDLSYNLLTKEELSREHFAGPFNNVTFEPLPIKHLNLAYNQIHSLPKDLFEHILNLEELNLEGNDFHVLDPLTQDVIASLNRLKRLNLANNELTELPQNAIKQLVGLEELNLSQNSLTFVPYDLPLLGRTLEVLYLDKNPIFEVTNKTFLHLYYLRELSLNNLPELDDIEEDAFTHLTSLRKLHMCNNTLLAKIHSNALNRNNSKLQELYLSDNALRELKLDDFDWSQLRTFEINNNPLECGCDLAEITQKLSTQITRSQNGPTCYDPNRMVSVAIYSITNETCEEFEPLSQNINKHFSTIRIILITFSVLTLLIMVIMVFYSYTKYRRHQLFPTYNTTQVIYNPVNAETYRL